MFANFFLSQELMQFYRGQIPAGFGVQLVEHGFGSELDTLAEALSHVFKLQLRLAEKDE
jgi:hypothetical protein